MAGPTRRAGSADTDLEWPRQGGSSGTNVRSRPWRVTDRHGPCQRLTPPVVRVKMLRAIGGGAVLPAPVEPSGAASV